MGKRNWPSFEAMLVGCEPRIIRVSVPRSYTHSYRVPLEPPFEVLEMNYIYFRYRIGCYGIKHMEKQIATGPTEEQTCTVIDLDDN